MDSQLIKKNAPFSVSYINVFASKLLMSLVHNFFFLSQGLFFFTLDEGGGVARCGSGT